MDYLSSEEYDLMFNDEYEQWLLNQNKKKYKKMRDTVYFVARYLVRGFELNTILKDYRSNYFEEISNANDYDFTSAMAFYDDMEDDIFEKRRAFMVSCDYDPSEELDEMWCEQTAEFYTDLFFN